MLILIFVVLWVTESYRPEPPWQANLPQPESGRSEVAALQREILQAEIIARKADPDVADATTYEPADWQVRATQRALQIAATAIERGHMTETSARVLRRTLASMTPGDALGVRRLLARAIDEGRLEIDD